MKEEYRCQEDLRGYALHRTIIIDKRRFLLPAIGDRLVVNSFKTTPLTFIQSSDFPLDV